MPNNHSDLRQTAVVGSLPLRMINSGTGTRLLWQVDAVSWP